MLLWSFRLEGHPLEFEDSECTAPGKGSMASARLPDAVHCMYVCPGIHILPDRLLDCLFCLHAFLELRRFIETHTIGSFVFKTFRSSTIKIVCSMLKAEETRYKTSNV